MTSTRSLIEDYIANTEPYYVGYPRNGVLPFELSGGLLETAPLRQQFPKFRSGLANIVELQNINLVRTGIFARDIVVTNGTVPAQTLVIIVSGPFAKENLVSTVRQIHAYVKPYMEDHAFNIEMYNPARVQGHLVAGPCLYSIERQVVVQKNLEDHLTQAVRILKNNVDDDLLTAGFYNSIFHKDKSVLGIRVKALAKRDWSKVYNELTMALPSSVSIMILPTKDTEAAAHTGFLSTFPRPPHVGSSIAAVGADQSGTLGAYFRLVNPKDKRERTVFLTNSHVIEPTDKVLADLIAKKGYQRGAAHGTISVSIQAPSHQDLTASLESFKSRLGELESQLERAQFKGEFERTVKDESHLDKNPAKIESRKETIKGLEATLARPQDAIIGHVLQASTLGLKGKRGSKMDWALVEYTQDETKIKNERPDLDRAPKSDPRLDEYEERSEVWELKKLEFNQWICFKGRTSGVRTGYTNGCRTFVRAASRLNIKKPIDESYELEGLAGDIPEEAELRAFPDISVFVNRLGPLTQGGDSGAVIWDVEGDIVGLTWGMAANQFGAIMTSIDEVVEDIKDKTGMDLEPIVSE
ncbi:hypothetical protein M436DRAFT_81508 [Aureobasidium namibiae CBS 147.97]|uniref:Uncharacterized protein n=1 Tax=Aureobasidium namibiae CBS 147.97 TaxID=1043004 RepID=A0A074WLZ3_9PEZI